MDGTEKRDGEDFVNSGIDVVTTWDCTKADGTVFKVETPADRRVVFTFEDPPEDQYHAPGETPPDVVVFCKGVQLARTS